MRRAELVRGPLAGAVFSEIMAESCTMISAGEDWRTSVLSRQLKLCPSYVKRESAGIRKCRRGSKVCQHSQARTNQVDKRLPVPELPIDRAGTDLPPRGRR